MIDKGTILMVDDTPVNLRLLGDILTAEGYQARSADSGELALAAVAASPPDLILLDVSMKGVDGLEVCRRFKTIEATRHIPIILLSATAGEKETVRGLQLGAADYITQPFQPEEILTRVKTHLSLSRANIALEQQAAALHQANEQLQTEMAERRRVEDELRSSLDRAERSRRAMLSTLEDQKRAEESLRKSEAQLRAILDATPFPIALVDVQDDNIDFWSRSALTLFGHTAPTAAEWYQMAYPDPDYRREVVDRWKPVLEKARRSAQPVNAGEYQVTCHNGSVRLCELYAAFLADRLVVTFNDVTERKRADAALRKSEEKHRVLIETTGTGFVIVDARGYVLDANDEYVRLAGYEKLAQILGRSVTEWTAAYDQARNAEEVKKCVVSGSIRGLELNYAHPDGTVVPIEVNATTLGTGDSLRIVTLCRDITERKRAEEALRESEQRYRTMLDQAADAVFMHDEKGRILDVDRKACQSLGYTREELLSKTIGDIDPEAIQAGKHAVWGKILAGESFTFESHQRRKDGSALPVEVTLGSVRLPLGPAVLGIVRDITERKRAEEALRESEHRYRTMLDQAADAIFVRDESGRILDVNRKACQSLGYTREELLSKSIRDIDLETIQAGNHEVWGRILAGESITFESHQRRKDGSAFPVEVTLGLVRLPMGPAVLGIARDITERKRAEEALRASEERFRHAVVDSPFPILLHAEDGQILQASQSWYEITGYTPEELRTIADWTERAYGERQELVRAEIDALYALAQRKYEGDYTIRVKDGTTRVWEFSSAPLGRLPDGRRLVMSMALDVTERRRAEAEVERTAREWQTTFDATNNAIWILDGDHRVVRSNKTAERFFHRPCCEMLGERCWAIVHHTTEPHPECPFVRARRSGHRETMELRQDERWFEITVDPILDTAGQYAGAVHIVSDITARKRVERTLHEAKELYSSLVETLPQSVLRKDLQGRFLFCNQRFCEGVGRSLAEILGKTDADFFPPQLAEAYRQDDLRVMASGHTLDQIEENVGADGRKMFVQVVKTPLRDASGAVIGIQGIFWDITERKQLEAQFLRAQRMEGIGSLAGGIAHDLNNLLSPILMTMPLLRAAVSDPESREMIDMVEDCTRRGADIIKQLLTFARGKPGARAPLPMRLILKEMDKLIRETFPRNIQSRVHAPEALWPVLGDATQIHQALMNLGVNARDAMPNGGTLTLAVENVTLDEAFAAMKPDAKPGVYVRVSVTDTGTGIAPEHVDRIFEPFFTTKEIGLGTGLGLATVLGIVRGHGGFVQVNSEVGRGTAFELYLPASVEAKAPAPPDTEAPPPRGRGELILAVDDEVSLRGAIQHTLEKHGYRVLAAGEGAEALALYGRHRAQVAAVVTDMMMPGMDGPKLVQALRQLDPQLPILGMTGLAERAGVKGLADLPLPVLLIKPFDGATLLLALSQALARSRPAPEAGRGEEP